jgi:hypothetical protein
MCTIPPTNKRYGAPEGLFGQKIVYNPLVMGFQQKSV